MKKIFSLYIGILLVSLCAKEVGGVQIKELINLNNTSLSLQGAGVRSKFFFDIYVGALYLKNKNNNPKQIIEESSPMDIRMVITSSLITRAKMKEGFNDDFKVIKHLGYKVDNDSLKKFLQTFDTKIDKKDIYDFAFFPKSGLIIYKNHKLLLTLKDNDFKKALYAIWLGTKPAQESLKKKMLGE